MRIGINTLNKERELKYISENDRYEMGWNGIKYKNAKLIITITDICTMIFSYQFLSTSIYILNNTMLTGKHF